MLEELIRRIPERIPAAAIGLPTGGARVEDVSVEEHDGTRNVRVAGAIDPHDPASLPIRFIVRLPERWNRRLMHFGGGGFDGDLSTMEHGGIEKNHWWGKPRVIDQGYATCGSDGGHTLDVENVGPAGLGVWECDWALDAEALRNFAHEAVKKTHDVAVALIRAAYGDGPAHSYFSGQSNGGREALKALQLYPDDFDGAIVSFPAINWTMMGIVCGRDADAEEREGTAGSIDADTYAKVDEAIHAICDPLDGYSDGLVCDLEAAAAAEGEVRAAVERILTPAQMRVLDIFAAPYDPGCAVDDFMNSMPPCRVFSGVPLRDDFGPFPLDMLSPVPGERTGEMAGFSVGLIAYQIMQDPGFEVRGFDPAEHLDEVRRASELLNATTPDLDAFFGRGGKLILEHGTEDSVIPYEMTVAYYRLLQERYGEALRDSCRLYLIPGYGHSLGRFDCGCDYLSALEDWVCEGKAPEGLVAQDRREERGGRTMALAEWPGMPTHAE